MTQVKNIKIGEFSTPRWVVLGANALIFLALYLILNSLLEKDLLLGSDTNFILIKLIIMSCIIIFVHEYIHYFAYLILGNVSRRNIQIGFYWKTLNPYCSCSIPVSVMTMRKVLIAPLIIIGSAVLFYTFLFPSQLIVLLACITVSMSTTDLINYWKLSKYRQNYFVVGHESKDFGLCIVDLKE